MTFIICSHSGSHSWTRTNDILINSQALYRLSYAGIFNFVLNHLYRLSFCRATLLPHSVPLTFVRVSAGQPLRGRTDTSYTGIFNFVLNHLHRPFFCRATLLPTPFPSLSFGSLRGNPSGAVPT